jgi:hypothetical protein
MRLDDFWLTRIQDNRMRGLLSELAEAIQDSENPALLNMVTSSIQKGLVNLAKAREQELRNERESQRVVPALSRAAVRLGDGPAPSNGRPFSSYCRPKDQKRRG